jgi:hypothetical protein
MKKHWVLPAAVVLIFLVAVPGLAGQVAKGGDDPEARPPVTEADVRIVKRAREILHSPSVEPCRYPGLPGGCQDLQPLLRARKSYRRSQRKFRTPRRRHAGGSVRDR